MLKRNPFCHESVVRSCCRSRHSAGNSTRFRPRGFTWYSSPGSPASLEAGARQRGVSPILFIQPSLREPVFSRLPSCSGGFPERNGNNWTTTQRMCPATDPAPSEILLKQHPSRWPQVPRRLARANSAGCGSWVDVNADSRPARARPSISQLRWYLDNRLRQ